jgi:hypothetical protein
VTCTQHQLITNITVCKSCHRAKLSEHGTEVDEAGTKETKETTESKGKGNKKEGGTKEGEEAATLPEG